MKKPETHISNSTEDTFRIAKKLASCCQPGDVVCLFGDLGAGKTHFVKGFATHFGISPDEVDSPTFVLIQEYAGTLPVYHFDAYRIESEAEARAIGTEDYLYGEGISVIEWPERIAGLLPESRIEVHIETTGKQQRRINLVYID